MGQLISPKRFSDSASPVGPFCFEALVFHSSDRLLYNHEARLMRGDGDFKS